MKSVFEWEESTFGVKESTLNRINQRTASKNRRLTVEINVQLVGIDVQPKKSTFNP
ncbi:hypothetical protein [Oceanobacillus limi]|uniref:hypothetical protein n=1 Tax=Oceanobacillus limi TaxID=930131 RepID=UPI00147A0042|nr:hypothetical protein [Oceanobacillus limi]